MEETKSYTGALAVTIQEIKLLKSFCSDFGINVTFNDAGTGIVLQNPTDIQKVLLQGFYFGLTREHLILTATETKK